MADIFADEFEEKITLAMCGSRCEHQWDGPYRQIIDGGQVTGEEATCSKCGAGAFEVAMMENEEEDRRKKSSLAAVIPQM